MDEIERIIADLTDTAPSPPVLPSFAPATQPNSQTPAATQASPTTHFSQSAGQRSSVHSTKFRQHPNYEVVKKELQKCPVWMLERLRDEIERRQKVERLSDAKQKEIDNYVNQLAIWKKKVLKQLYDYQKKVEEQAQQQFSGSDAAILRDLVHKKDEQLKQKDQQLYTMQQILKLKDKEISEKDLQIKRLTEKMEGMKQHLLSGSYEKLVVDRPISPGPGDSDSSAPVPSDDVHYRVPNPVVSAANNSSNNSNNNNININDNSNLSLNSRTASWLDANGKNEAIVELLFSPELLVVSTLFELKVSDELLKVVLQLYEARSETMKLFNFVIDKEVAKTKTESTLFRANNVASKLMTFYTSILGTPYLSEVIRPLVMSIIDKNESLEVDPNKASDGNLSSVDVNDNLTKISEISQNFIDTVLNSLDKIPYQFREVCNLLVNSISKKFPEDVLSGVKNFIFLRYICPSILSPPAAFGIGDIKEEAHRTLVLVSKVMQNVVNGVHFKEPYLLRMNGFVTENSLKMKQFMSKLGEIPARETSVIATLTKNYSVRESVRILSNAIAEVKPQLIEKLHSYDHMTFSQNLNFKTGERLISVAMNIGMPKKGKKIPLIQGDSKTDDLIALLVQEDLLVGELADAANMERDKDKICHALMYVLATHNVQKAANLVKACIEKETEAASPADFPLMDSMTARTFGYLCEVTCSKYLGQMLIPFIEELSEFKEENLKSGSDKLMEFTQKILAIILKSLTSAPEAIWNISRYLFDSTRSNSVSQPPIERVVMFLFWIFFCPAIDSPESFGVETEIKKKVRKGLHLISEVLRSITYDQDEGIRDARFLQFIKKRREVSCQIMEEWLNHPSFDNSILVMPMIVWPNLEESLRIVHAFLCDKMSIINAKLGTAGTTKQVTFRLSEIMDLMVASQTKTDSTKSSVF